MKFALVLLPFIALTARAGDESLMTIHRIETETADRIQARVLDPILGPGQSSAFVKLKVEVKREQEYSDHLGEGQATTFVVKSELSSSTTTKAASLESPSWFEGIGLTDAARPPYQQSSGHQQAQAARQTRGDKEERIATTSRYTMFRLIILHDARISPRKISAARSALLAIYKADVMDLKFYPVEFSALK